MAFLIYAFAGDAPLEIVRGYHFIALIVPAYFLSFFLIEIIADYRPGIRVLGLPILLLMVLSLILTKNSISIWRPFGKPMIFSLNDIFLSGAGIILSA
jgi:hypothetical protein